MCGIFGIVNRRGRTVPLNDTHIERLRDLMTHRGPDDAGLWRRDNAALAHRRLAVIDPTPAGRQPMHTPDGRFTLVYNGMLYNDAELRARLSRLGALFHTHCDTETVLLALAHWGADALPRLRGMYALALYDSQTHTLLLARDPLGVKPLYFRISPSPTATVIFASEPRPILAHPEITPEPDLETISAYLTTIRTTLGNRTLFEGIRILQPGQALRIDLSDQNSDTPSLELFNHWPSDRPEQPAALDEDDAVQRVRAAITESIDRHLRSDVPLCALLSGGLDSSIIATRAARTSAQPLRTFCAGAADGDDASPDLEAAKHVASRIGAAHAEARLTPDAYANQWRWMIDATGLPLSTPNEVAILEIARLIRASGCTVTLSGEGADELFGGYEQSLTQARGFIAQSESHRSDDPLGDAARFQLNATSWTPASIKPLLIRPRIWSALRADEHLQHHYHERFAEIARSCPTDDPLEPHLRFQRSVNLAGLLLRLDSATMLASVEGRTPFADRAVADLAESLPMRFKFDPSPTPPNAHATKRILRRAFENDLPPSVLSRPKASFPVPFQKWIATAAAALDHSPFADFFFEPAGLAAVMADPERHWRIAWPVLNIVMWADRWWGDRAPSEVAADPLPAAATN